MNRLLEIGTTPASWRRWVRFRCAAGLLLTGLVVVGPLMAREWYTGRILDDVVCGSDPAQHYVLYVPSHYDRNLKWPVIFCFDASAHGRVPVELLQAAAEKYGYLIAGSLNSRNGPWKANSTAAGAMIKDVTAHFSIDNRRIYAAGVSGGARVGTALALSGLVKGVIACSAGFPEPDKIPGKIAFAFFGTAGSEDFNYWEMRKLDGVLGERGASHRLVIFDGSHGWASAGLMAEAVEWMELQAMKSGTRPHDEAFVQLMLGRREAEMEGEAGLQRLRSLESLAGDFGKLLETDKWSREAGELRESPEVGKQEKSEHSLSDREEALVEKLGEAALESRGWKRKLASDLRHESDRAEDSPERRMTRRAIAAYRSMTRQKVRELFDQREYGQASAMLELSDFLKPGQVEVLFDLARSYAFDGDKKEALATLNRAADAGLRNAPRMEAEPAFAKLRDDPSFVLLADRMRFGDIEAPLELPPMRVSLALASIEVRLFSLPDAEATTPRLSFLRVERVRPNTTAALAGIEAGMEITAIQGTRIHGLTEEELGGVMAGSVQDEIVVRVRESAQGNERDVHIRLPGSPRRPVVSK
jgi:hypothetical protein